MALWIVIFLVSLAALIKAADWFTEGAEELGVFLGMPSYVVGVTIVAIGTSLPELVSSIFAVVEGSPEIVTGNAVGSNVTNIFLVLGLAAILGGRLSVSREIVRIDLPMLASSAALMAFSAIDGTVSRTEGLLLLAGAVIYGFYGLRISRPSPAIRAEIESSVKEEISPRRDKLRPAALLKLAGGVAVLYFAAEYTIKSVIELSALLGVGTDIIAISAVALGTSLPELVVSVVAARRGKLEIAIGNVLGSNVFNAFAVVGIPALISPLPVTDTVILVGLPFMGLATVLYFFMAQDREVTRWEGMPLILFYILFLGKLFELF
ncbi:MAG TPA: calcium/sodium antiporter [Thermoleophilia bacterium]|nr:calcium/sodium antiporter [Thermoleophilia bacterium]